VLDIVELYEQRGLSPDDIASRFPAIAVSDVHAALAYYNGHPDEIRRDAISEDAALDETMRTSPSPVLAKRGPDRRKDKAPGLR